MSYEKTEDGEWVQPIPRGYKLQCCDCGLVHRIDFRVIKYARGKRTKVQFRARRDGRATGGARAGRGIRVKFKDTPGAT